MKDPKKEKSDSRLYNKNFIQAWNNAMNGIVYCTTTQTNIRKQLIIGALVLILSLFYDFQTSEFLCLLFAVFFVIFAEVINTAIETIVDLLTEVYNPKAKIAKDVGAGAVVIAAINAVIVAYFLFFNETQIAQIGENIFQRMVSSPSHLIFVGVIFVIIAIIAVKADVKAKEMKTGKKSIFVPSGQAALSFAILTMIWIKTQDSIVFCLALILAILVVGNRMNDKRTFGEVVFGAFMGILIIVLLYGLTIFKLPIQ